MAKKTLAAFAGGMLALSAPAQLYAQDAATTTTSVDREDDFNLGWLGLLGLAGLLGLKRKDDHVRPTATTNTRA